MEQASKQANELSPMESFFIFSSFHFFHHDGMMMVAKKKIFTESNVELLHICDI